MACLRAGLSLALALTTLAGCQSVLPFVGARQASFVVGRDDSGAIVAASGSALQTGGLRVNFRNALAQLAQRRILATLANVDHVVVTVKPTGAAAVSQTVPKSAIASGQTTATFTGLPVGAAEVSVVVYDATGATLGTSTQQTAVLAGQAATVDLFVQLTATTLPPISGGGGSSMPTTGQLDAQVTLQDGAVIQPLAGGGTVETYKMPFMPTAIGVTSTGAAWVTGGYQTNDQYTNVLVKLSSSGAILKWVTLEAQSVSSLAVDGSDHVWVPGSQSSQNVMLEYDDAGTLVSSHALPSGYFLDEHVRLDKSGRFLFKDPSGMTGAWSWATDGSVTSFPSGRIPEPGINNDVWATLDYASPDVVHRFGSSGTELASGSVGAGFTTAYSAVDAAGNAWVTAYKIVASPSSTVLSDGKVVRMSPNGTILGTTVLSVAKAPQCIHFAPDGRVWVLDNSQGSGGTATWLDANGAEKGHVDIGNIFPWEFATGISGAWAFASMDNTVVRIAPAAD